ncbi:uncharacterized protein LOC129587086 [Paramacrobiotus metropolitanus]|uniref:uncharacterized protein LOC129587086 n=1 Tax=Paramacrobiotus metropolitanus TaxID=2943436 RepID=UPI002445FEC5|nr:uncharacterized protein LOC129587086 [Paramacrobiotus metropolitanus]
MDAKKPEKSGILPGTLTFQDFIPEAIPPANEKEKNISYASFPSTGQAANNFLANNPDLEVVSCETIAVKLDISQWTGSVKHKSYDTIINQTSYRQYGENALGTINALRLWLRPVTTAVTPQKIGWKTVTSNYHGHHVSLMELAEQINLQHKTTPIPGRIINVQSLTFCSKDGPADVESSIWKLTGSEIKSNFTQAFRIFYIMGEPCRSDIGFADFFPQSDDGKTVKQFSQIMRDINNFREGLPGSARFLNIQTLLCREELGKPISSMYSTHYQTTLFWERFIRFLRVVYLVRPEESKVAPPAYETPKVTAKLFTPAVIKDPTAFKPLKFEDLEVMRDRLGYWMSQQSAKVLAVESVSYKVVTGAEKLVGLGAMNTWHETVDDKHGTRATWEMYVRCVRVYFEGETSDPQGFYWPRSVDDVRKQGKLDQCVII